MSQQLRYAQLLGGIIFHHQQALAAARGVVLDPGQGGLQALGCGGLGYEGESPAGQSVLPVFVQRDDLHRDVPGGRILLQLTQDRPAEHIGQEDVQRDCRRPELADEIEAFSATRGHQYFEPLFMGQVDQRAGIMRVVLDNQQRWHLRAASCHGRPGPSRPGVRASAPPGIPQIGDGALFRPWSE